MEQNALMTLLMNFLKTKIIHQSTCWDTHKQNEIVERKNRHLLEVAHAIMFSMHVPKYLWKRSNSRSYLSNK